MEAEHVSRGKGLVAELERVKASLHMEELRKQVDTCKAELEMLVKAWGGGYSRSGGKVTSFGCRAGEEGTYQV